MTYKGYTIKSGYWVVSGRERYDAAVYDGRKFVALTEGTYETRKEARAEARRMVDAMPPLAPPQGRYRPAD